MGDRLRAYIQRAIGRQQRPAEMRKGMPGVAGQASLGAASVQPAAPAKRVYSVRDADESEILSEEEQALLDRSKGGGRHARRAAEAYAAQYRRQ